MSLGFLYGTVPGRVILKLLVRPWVSRFSGLVMDMRISRLLIPGFVRRNGIDMSEYEDCHYPTFNSFFYRRTKPGKREFDMDTAAFVAPCDGLLSAYNITDDLVIPVKQSRFSISGLLRDEKIAEEFRGGTCLVFRLCVNHYHRYAFNDYGTLGEYRFIPGVLHTVRPIALENVPVFTENSREVVIMDTDNFGRVAQIEVGAMLVGKISNNRSIKKFSRGEEKGYFEYGGSTIIQLLRPGCVTFPENYYEATARGEEIPVRMGQRLGCRG